MALGFTNSHFFVNSASGDPPGSLLSDGMEYTDAQGRVPLDQVVREAQQQGCNVTAETIAGTLVIARVAVRRELERLTGRGKRQANRIIEQYSVVNSAPMTIAKQPAYTMEQIEALADHHKRQARRNKVRFRTGGDQSCHPLK